MKKQPLFWVSLLLVILITILGYFFFFSNKDSNTPNQKVLGQDIQMETNTSPTTTKTNSENLDGKELVKKPNKEPVILVYHTVEPKTDKKEGVMQKRYHIFPENFKAQMQYLKDNGYTVISMKKYLGYLNSQNNVPEKSVVLTFDDGWKNQYTYAYPILKDFDYTATFYIITNIVGGKSYMTWDDIKELEKTGMDIESHTATHQNLTKINMDIVKKELIISKNKLEVELGHTVGMVAYPYYGNNSEVQKIVQEVGYTSARAGWTKYKNSHEVIFSLQSQEVSNNKNPFSSIVEK